MIGWQSNIISALWSELVFRAGTAKNSSFKVPSRQLTPSCYDGAKIPLHATVLFTILRVKFLRSLARYRTAHLTMIGWQSIVVLNCKSLLRFVSKIKLRCGRAVPGSDDPQEGLHGQAVSHQIVFEWQLVEQPLHGSQTSQGRQALAQALQILMCVLIGTGAHRALRRRL